MNPELSSQLAKAHVADMRRSAARTAIGRPRAARPTVLGRLRTIRGR